MATKNKRFVNEYCDAVVYFFEKHPHLTNDWVRHIQRRYESTGKMYKRNIHELQYIGATDGKEHFTAHIQEYISEGRLQRSQAFAMDYAHLKNIKDETP